MDETDKEEPWISRNLGNILAVIVAVAVTAAVVAASFYTAYLGGLPISDNSPDRWGQLGDYFGGLLNPVFSFLTILALVLTLILQSRELKLSREELELSRTELRNSAEALRGQNKAIDRQSFEQSFFSWLSNYKQLIDSVQTHYHSGESYGRIAMQLMLLNNLPRVNLLWDVANILFPVTCPP